MTEWICLTVEGGKKTYRQHQQSTRENNKEIVLIVHFVSIDTKHLQNVSLDTNRQVRASV